MRYIHKISVYFATILSVLAIITFSQATTAEAKPVNHIFGIENAGEEDDSSQTFKRDMVFDYVMISTDFMDSGNYEQYLEQFIYADDPPQASEEQNRDNDLPISYLKFMGLDDTDCFVGNDPVDYSYNRAFCSDLFYMEYPLDWSVGAIDTCPFVFHHNVEDEQSGAAAQDWQEFYDDKLKGSMDDVKKYVENGGIDKPLEVVIGEALSDEYEMELEASSEDIILYVNLKKGEKQKASIVVWTNIGKFMARNEDVKYVGDKKDDYGRIMVYQEWDDVDFSTRESIMEYMTSGRLGLVLSPVFDSAVPWEASEYQTEYHDFMRFNADFGDRQASVYIPVTPSYSKNWLIVCEAYKDSEMFENAYDIQERIIKTFIALPYKYQVKKGDNLSVVAEKYTGNPDNYSKIANYKTNSIKNRNLIYPGQKIEIPLGLLFEKTTYQ